MTTYEYDQRGNRTAVIDAQSHRTEFAYDLGNRLTTITYPDSTTASFAYDSRGRRTSATDQNGKTTTYTYDDADRLLTVTDAASNVTSYSYDTENNLLSITDANSHTTTFTYDAEARVTQTTFPSGLLETYGYDAMGNLTAKTDRKQQTIGYEYDVLDRLIAKTYPDSSVVQYVYDSDSRLAQVSDATGTYGFTYDNMGRLAGTTVQYSFLPGQTFTNSYTYDAASNRTGFTAPDGSTNTYGYDTLNRLTNLSNSWAGSFGFGYDTLSRRTSLTRPNSITTNYTYDSLSRLLSVLHQAGATTIDGATYTVDAVGNRQSKTNHINSTTENYTYDLIYQLTQVAQGGSTTESYGYDAVGNRLSSLGVSPYQYNNSNQLTLTPSTTFTYDNNGNMLTKVDASGTTSYAWDFENRLTSVTLPNGAGTVTFKYDPIGRRIQKSSANSTTNYVYDGAVITDELDVSGAVVTKYAHSMSIDEPLAISRAGATSYYHADGQGTITSLTDGSGAAVAVYTYDTFGKPLSGGGVVNPFRYTGRELDQETGLYYYRARYYDPETGRFVSEDPIGFDGGINFYAYVENGPADGVDPFGLRDIIVVIWNKKVGEASVGHAAAFEMDGKLILSQFPDCSVCTTGKNVSLNWNDTRKREGRDPDRVFRVHVPNDEPFDKAAKNHRKRRFWNWYPTKLEVWETNCVFSVTRALKAGGVVPMPDYDWPGNLGDDLAGKANEKGKPWSVSPLSTVPWPSPSQ